MIINPSSCLIFMQNGRITKLNGTGRILTAIYSWIQWGTCLIKSNEKKTKNKTAVLKIIFGKLSWNPLHCSASLVHFIHKYHPIHKIVNSCIHKMVLPIKKRITMPFKSIQDMNTITYRLYLQGSFLKRVLNLYI